MISTICPLVSVLRFSLLPALSGWAAGVWIDSSPGGPDEHGGDGDQCAVAGVFERGGPIDGERGRERGDDGPHASVTIWEQWRRCRRGSLRSPWSTGLVKG